MKKKNTQRGYTIISLLLALVIILILVGNYMGPDKEKQKTWAQTNIDRSKDVTCAANRTQITTQLSMFQINHPGKNVTIESMQAANYSIPTCPSGGKYSIGDKNEIYCSIHAPDPNAPPPATPTAPPKADEAASSLIGGQTQEQNQSQK